MIILDETMYVTQKAAHTYIYLFFNIRMHNYTKQIVNPR